MPVYSSCCLSIVRNAPEMAELQSGQVAGLPSGQVAKLPGWMRAQARGRTEADGRGWRRGTQEMQGGAA